VITAGQLIVGDGEPPLKDQMIVIQKSKIIDVGPENELKSHGIRNSTQYTFLIKLVSITPGTRL